jgi:hypothetical protein
MKPINLAGVRRQTISIYWTQLSRLHLKVGTKFSLRKVGLSIKDTTMDNAQNCDNYINIPSSQTYMSYKQTLHYLI